MSDLSPLAYSWNVPEEGTTSLAFVVGPEVGGVSPDGDEAQAARERMRRVEAASFGMEGIGGKVIK